jgi:membrane protein DedA with SNARE-associated domain
MKEYWNKAKKYSSENWEIFFAPVIFIITLLAVQFAWRYFGFPTQDDLIKYVQTFFLTYGLWVIFISSIVESMLFLGWYFPGSLVIFLGVASTAGHPYLAVKTVLAVSLGMFIGYCVNYVLGKYGWYKLLMKFGFKEELMKIEKRLLNKGMFASFFLYVMPGFGSLLSTAFGVLKFSPTKFLLFTALMVVFWNSIWGFLVYLFGMSLFKLLTNSVSMFVIFCLYFFYMYNKQKESKEQNQNL